MPFRMWNSGLGITFNLSGVLGSSTATGAGGSTDTFSNIEALRGSNVADRFNGGSANSYFEGLGGNDIFVGGSGMETVSYLADATTSGGTRGVYAALASNLAIDGFGNTDSLTAIDIIYGTTLTPSPISELTTTSLCRWPCKVLPVLWTRRRARSSMRQSQAPLGTVLSAASRPPSRRHM